MQGAGISIPAPSLMCARHVVCLGGESPLRAATSGTDRLSKGVGREAESEGSDGGRASVTGVQTRRTGIGYKAVMQGQSSMRSRRPYSFRLRGGKSGGR